MRAPSISRTGRAARGWVLSLLCVVALLALPTPASADAVPDPVAVLGGPLHAEFYASGLEVAPDGTIVIADTGNSQVAKYDQDGNQLWRVGGPGPDVGEFLRPRDVSVSSNGTIFVVDAENERIVRLGPDGSWLGVLDTPARYFLGGSFKGDKYYLADISRKVRIFDVAGNELQVISENGICNDLFDIRDATADSNGRVYVANYRENAINVFSPDGTCLFSFGSTGTANGQFRTPYGVATGFDPVLGQELLYVADANNNRVQVFRLDGTFVGKFGTQGSASQPGTFYTLRRVSVSVDGSGDLWVADLWGWRIERWARTPTGWQYAETIGTGMPPTTDTAVFHEPRGLAVDAQGVVHVMDSIHHQMVRMNQNGTIANRCGTRGSGNGQFNWPRDLDIDEATGDIWITDTKFNRIQILRPNCAFVAKRGSAGTGPSQFTWPRSIAIRQSDRTAWITDTQNDRVVVWNVATREVIGQYGTGNPGSGPGQLNRPMGIAVDEATGHVFVADTINNRIVELTAGPGATNIQEVRTLTAGFDEPEAIEVSADGTIYVADTADSEIVMLAPDGSVIGTFGSTEGLDHPAGITVGPDGKVFVSDSFHDRVVVYSSEPFEPPPVDQETPNATVSVPTPGQSFATSPVTFTGNATDDLSVSRVRVGIRNTATAQWWNGTGWQSAFVTQDATLTAAGTTSTGWSLSWAPPAAGSFAIQVIAVDGADKTDPTKPWVTFSYAPAVSDQTPPNATVSVPVRNAAYPLGPITFSGNATDDVSVTNVRVAIRNTATAQWWNGSGWGTAFVNLEATLTAPGTTSTGWSLGWSPPAAGSFAVQVTAVDGSGKVDPTKPWVPFRMT
jgi:hypothetical protein